MITLKNASIYQNGSFKNMDVEIDNGIITRIEECIDNINAIDLKGKVIVPGFTDPHVHLREPGFEKKGTIKTETKAAARGGYTRVFAMPNINPVPNDYESLKKETEKIKKDALIEVLPIGAITKDLKHDELSKMEEIAPYVVGFSNDGFGVNTAKTMLDAMIEAKRLGKIIISHSEDESLKGGVINECEYAKRHNHQGVLDITETLEVGRNLILAKKIDARIHFCHISTKESIDLIRYYKSQGVRVTLEVSPHHLILSDKDLKEDGNYKMNPPLQSEESRCALIEALIDKTIDCIATDHAPHEEELKKKGLDYAPFGIIGLETSFPLLYTELVLKNKISLSRLIDLMSDNVNRIFGLSLNEIEIGNEANLTVIDLNEEYIINKEDFESLGVNTPFINRKVQGKIKMTICKGEIVYAV